VSTRACCSSPARAPFDLWDRDRRHGIKLYVRRVFIMDDTKHLMPAYLRFVRGVVDSADLPLNVSREFLQRNEQIDRIRAASVKKVLGEIKRIAENEPERYAGFWKEFGRVMKEGIIEDHDNRETLLELVRFASTHDAVAEQKTSLADYHRRMPLKQKAIYYLTAETWQQAKDSPHLEVFRKQGVEVLLLTDPVDEWVVNAIGQYQDKPLKSVARGGLDEEEVGEDEKKAAEAKQGEFASMLERLKGALGDRVKDVTAQSAPDRFTRLPDRRRARPRWQPANAFSRHAGQDAPELEADHRDSIPTTR
jgi:molecular chaperone HtpG